MVAKKNLCVLILAGGKGTRMKSALPKPLHAVNGAPILSYIIKTSQRLKPAAIGVLTGHQSAEVKTFVQDNLSAWGIKTPVDFLLQKNLSGSGTAAKDSLPFFKKYQDVLILAGDAPLIQTDTLKALYKQHSKDGAACTVFSVNVDNPYGYGRIVRDAKNNFLNITEEAGATARVKAIREVNSGIYIFNTAKLSAMLKFLKPQGPKKEYYLTEVLGLLKQKGGKISVFTGADYTEALGINSMAQLAQAAKIMRARVAAKHMANGVNLITPEASYIEEDVKIGQGTIIYPGCNLMGKTVIGKNCFIEPACWIEDGLIKNNVHIKRGCYIKSSQMDDDTAAGPYAHLRPGAILKQGAKVGNFVEIKKAVIGKGSKVPHLTYIGDAVLGQKVNVGAGSITCNYDGAKKHQTKIGDNVFVGSNTNFVAPVVIGRGAKIGAGSTITQDIPSGYLSIARARQVNLNKRKK